MLSVVHSFTDLSQGEVDIHGGKGASLITMTGAGMPVPPVASCSAAMSGWR